MNKYLNKTVSFVFLLSSFAVLFFSSRWVNKNLYIRSVVESPRIAKEEGVPQTEDIEDSLNVEQPDEYTAFKQISIENVLDYLQTKYGEEFKSIEFKDGGILKAEELLVYPTSGSDLLDTVKVERQVSEDGQDKGYADDYMNILARKKYRPKIEGMIKELIDLPFYLNMEVRHTDCETKEELNSEAVKEQGIEARMSIYFPSTEDEGMLSEITQMQKELADELCQEGIAGEVEVVYINVNNFEDVDDITIRLYDDKYITSREVIPIEGVVV